MYNFDNYKGNIELTIIERQYTYRRHTTNVLYRRLKSCVVINPLPRI